MIYAVIDTNVLVAAAKSHKPHSSASQVLTLVFSGIIQPLVCDEILEEYEGILNLPVLAIPEELSRQYSQNSKMTALILVGRPQMRSIRIRQIKYSTRYAYR